MKKLFLSMLAAVTLFASCSQEEIVSQTGNESLVSFSVITPELGSRVAGDGAAATDLYFVVYDETEGVQVETISSKQPYDEFTNKKANIELALLNGHKYSLVFWAENPACPYAVDWDKKSINLEATTLNSNSETYDAFYAYVEPFTVTGPKQSTIELKRPFAQLNIGTTSDDLAGVSKYFGLGDNLFTQSSIVVTTPTTMDLTTGNVSGEEELTFAAANFLTEKLKGDYEYLSMNYLLVSNEKSLVDVKFSVTDGTTIIDKTFENIPVQRNYKTNIYGNLFTSATDWTVDVAPGFDAPEYNPAEQLAALFEQGGEMTLYTDITLAEPLVLTEGKTVTLNLNGNTIKGGLFTESNGTISEGNTDSYPIWVQGGTLNIKGEGTIEAQAAKYSMAVFATAGEVNIYGGEFYNAGEGSDLIYAKGTAKINIYGGYFKACEKQAGTDGTAEKHSALNLHDGSKTTASITVYGGTFYKFDPANNKSENPAISFVAEGYSSLAAGDDFVVVKGKTVASAEEFTTALQSTDVVILVDDVELSETFAVNKDITINLNGHNFDASTNKSRPFNVENGKLTIVGGNSTIKVGAYGLVNIPEGSDAEIVLEGGIYEGNTDNGALLKPRGEGKINITLKNVKYNDKSNNGYVLNLASYEGEQFVIKVEGGEFVAGGGFQLTSGSSIKNTTIKNTNPSQLWNAVEFTGDATIENSTILSEGYAITTGFGAKATVKNCSVESELYAYCVYPTGGEINVTGGSYVGQLYIYDLYTDAAPAKIVIDNDIKVSK